MKNLVRKCNRLRWKSGTGGGNEGRDLGVD